VNAAITKQVVALFLRLGGQDGLPAKSGVGDGDIQSQIVGRIVPTPLQKIFRSCQHQKRYHINLECHFSNLTSLS
jgi:hypothetical protein